MYHDIELRRIKELTPAEFELLASNLTTVYRNLRIKGITAEGKAARIVQFTDLMQGKSVRQIAEELRLNDITLRAGLYKMADGIAARVSYDELSALIPESGTFVTGEQVVPLPALEKEPEEAEEAQEEQLEEEPEGLGKEQIRWLGRLFDDEAVVETIIAMKPEQRTFLSERFSHWAYPAIVRKLGPDRTRARIEFMKTFLSNQSREEIAASVGVTDEAVRQALYHVGRRLKETATPRQLLDLVEEARRYSQ
jgi:hypothetical protein